MRCSWNTRYDACVRIARIFCKQRSYFSSASRNRAARISATAHRVRQVAVVGSCFASFVRFMSASNSMRVGLDAFCFKQFEAAHIGPRIPLSTTEFLSIINDELLLDAVMVDGYAPFCKHVFVPSFFKCPVSAMPISDSLLPLIRSK